MSHPSPPRYTSTKTTEAASLANTQSSFSSLGKHHPRSHHQHERRGHKHRFSLHRALSHSSTSSSSSDSSSASSIKSDSSAASHQKLRALKYKFKDWKKEIKVQKKAIKREVKVKVKGSKGGRNPKGNDKLGNGAVSEVVQFEEGNENLPVQESGVGERRCSEDVKKMYCEGGPQQQIGRS